MDWMYMMLLWTFIIAAGLVITFAPPILLGMLLRVAFQKVSDNLLSLLGGAVILFVLSLISNSDTTDFFVSQVLYLWQFTPVIAVIMAFVFVLSAMAVPFLMVSRGVNTMDKIKSNGRISNIERVGTSP